MPTVTIGGVKHTPGYNTLKRMRKATAPSSVNSAKGVADTNVKRAGGSTPRQAAPPKKREKPPIPATKSAAMIAKTNVGKRATKPLLNSGRPIGFSNTKYTGPFAKPSKPSGPTPPVPATKSAMTKFQTEDPKARIARFGAKAEASRPPSSRGGRRTGGGF